MRRAAILAEELGFADVWVSDHLVVPADADYPPSAYLYEPLVTLAWIAAATHRIGLGTSVLVMPMRNPIALAKMLASIDQMSGGRVLLGAAAGWCEPEFEALGVPFTQRGKRTDEALEMVKALWTEDPLTRDYPVHGARLEKIRAKPQPAHDIPIWIGGHADVALARAARHDGWHAAFLKPEKAAPLVDRLRALRPDDDFTISVRTNRDPQKDDHGLLLEEIERYREIGVGHLVMEPRQREADGFLKSIEMLAELLDRAGAEMGA